MVSIIEYKKQHPAASSRIQLAFRAEFKTLIPHLTAIEGLFYLEIIKIMTKYKTEAIFSGKVA